MSAQRRTANSEPRTATGAIAWAEQRGWAVERDEQGVPVAIVG